MKKQMKIKEPVKVRTKKLANGCQSVYLDIYMNGKRQYDFLRLYIIPEHNPADKRRNVETMNLANAIKSQRIIEMQNRAFGFNSHRCSNVKLTDYLESVADQSRGNAMRKNTIHAVISHLKRYTPGGILLREVDKPYLLGFIDYLRTAKQKHCKEDKRLHPNTQAYYFKMLRYCMNRAVSEEYIATNPIDKIRLEDTPRRIRASREYLTMDELAKLAHTPFYNDLLKRAFLFSCFCGLRHCDIVSLKWKNIHRDEAGNVSLNIIQQKTKEAISLPLSREAVKQIPDNGSTLPDNLVFAGLISLGRSNEILSRWARLAGISKHVTFHCARHTYATMMLTLGVDLYTISKLLGHADIQTTQIYTKLTDDSKKKAVVLIPDIT